MEFEGCLGPCNFVIQETRHSPNGIKLNTYFYRFSNETLKLSSFLIKLYISQFTLSVTLNIINSWLLKCFIIYLMCVIL